jgi:cell division protein FtsI (penicillin-binding protein 3)
MTAAQMRKMMEGVVLYGTGKPAQLNGFSSGGKTGTAQKSRSGHPSLYSKTMHIASFAGIAPVNNPVIAVAVVHGFDPKGAYYGAAVSAPVFAEVAQQVLEYLGVPHDIDARRPVRNFRPKPRRHVAEDDAHDQSAGDISALYAAANDLPSDDPLRGGGDDPLQGGGQGAQQAGGNASAASLRTTAEHIAYRRAAGPSHSGTQASGLRRKRPGRRRSRPGRSRRIRSSSPRGKNPARSLAPRAAGAQGDRAGRRSRACEVEITGSGTVREQAPSAGHDGSAKGTQDRGALRAVKRSTYNRIVLAGVVFRNLQRHVAGGFQLTRAGFQKTSFRPPKVLAWRSARYALEKQWSRF